MPSDLTTAIPADPALDLGADPDPRVAAVPRPAPQPQEPPAPAGTLTAVLGVPDGPVCGHCHRPARVTVPANDGVPPW